MVGLRARAPGKLGQLSWHLIHNLLYKRVQYLLYTLVQYLAVLLRCVPWCLQKRMMSQASKTFHVDSLEEDAVIFLFDVRGRGHTVGSHSAGLTGGLFGYGAILARTVAILVMCIM